MGASGRRDRDSVAVLTTVVALFGVPGPTTTVEAQATFTAGVNTVGTYVTVVADNGPAPPRLSAGDFEVREDGKVRPITLFEAGALPMTIAVLIDDSPSMRASQPSTQAAAAAFVQRLTPLDRATVGIFSRTVRLEGELTSDHAELMKRLRAPAPLTAGTALWDAVNAGMAALEDESGRRIVLVLTDGDDNSSEIPASRVATKATSDGVMVYAIGLHGERGRLSKGLRELARETGGSFVELKGSDDLSAAFERVAEELRGQYLIGFTRGELDGKVHRLEVKVKRSGLTARARRSYVAALNGTAAR